MIEIVNKISAINNVNSNQESVNINNLLECVKYIINYIVSQKSEKNKYKNIKKLMPLFLASYKYVRGE